ncbi:MAG: bifunctional oligoribonuclease/PAP phosphatase NrnA [Zetaproteobacteria bacterium]|nr:MAG: bifunctional oligoribonuclease/PAP phosphatase NrnA [Zetaproteobacteria bacterium]
MNSLYPETDWSSLCRAVRESSRIVLTTHRNPDGDGIGSQIALFHGLRLLGKPVQMHNRDGVPRIYRFLAGSEQIGQGQWPEASAAGDLVICLDSGSQQRLGLSASFFDGARVANIDHHLSNTRFGDYVVVDPRYCATGAMVFDFLLAMKIPVNAEIAQALYTSLLTDTCGFRLASVDASVHRLAADLVECGASPWDISMHVYESRRLASMRLLGLCLESLELHDGGRSAWLAVTADMYRETGADVEDTEGLIDYARSIDGVEVAVLIRADESEHGSWKISFRGKSHADVGKLASSLGGGGHPHAAGCRMQGDLEKVRDHLRQAVRRLLANEGS